MTQIEIQAVRRQLKCFGIDVPSLLVFLNITSLFEFSRKLVETKKSQIYFLLDKLISLVLTLPYSKETTNRAFSAIKLIKTTHQNKAYSDFFFFFRLYDCRC